MKRMLKKFFALVCTLACVLGCMTEDVFAVNLDDISYDEDTEKAMQEEYESIASSGTDLSAYGISDADSLIKYYAEQFVASYLETSYLKNSIDKLKKSLTGDEEADATLNNYINEAESAGDYKDVKVESFSSEDGEMVLTGKIQYSKSDVAFTMNLSTQDGSVTFSFEREKSLGEKMKNAALNTLLGMGTVFVVLIFLCLVISCFNLFNKEEKKENKEEVKKADKEVLDLPVQAEEDVTDDSELVAVISSAIAAYEGTSSEGFQVRSVKRVRLSK